MHFFYFYLHVALLVVCAHFIAVEPLPVFSLSTSSNITNPYNSTQSINTSPQKQTPPPLPPLPPTPSTPTTQTDLFRQSIVKTISPKRVTIINDDTEYVLNDNAQLSYINYSNSINNTPTDYNRTSNSFNNSFNNNNEIRIDIDRSYNKGI